MQDAISLLQASLDELLEGDEPATLRRAQAALRRLEETGSREEATAFVRESMDWLDRAFSVAFKDYPAPAPILRRIRLLVGQAPLRVPFSAWWLSLSPHRLWLAYVDHVRSVAAEYGLPARRLAPPLVEEVDQLSAELSSSIPQAKLFKLLSEELATVMGAWAAIGEIRETLDLTMAELARIFGEKREVVEQWSEQGAPPGRRAEIDRVLEVSRYLSDMLRPERIPAAIRRPAERLNGKSMLDVLQEDGPSVLLAHLRAILSYQLI